MSTHYAEKNPINPCWEVRRDFSHPQTGEDCLEVLATVYGENRAARHERATLYAAAPDLLAALRGLLASARPLVREKKLHPKNSEHFSWMVAEVAAQNAIAKAEGGAE